MLTRKLTLHCEIQPWRISDLCEKVLTRRANNAASERGRQRRSNNNNERYLSIPSQGPKTEASWILLFLPLIFFFIERERQREWGRIYVVMH